MVTLSWSDGLEMRNPCFSRKAFRIRRDSIKAASATAVFSAAHEALAATLILWALTLHFPSNIAAGNQRDPDAYLKVSRLYVSCVPYLPCVRLLFIMKEIHAIETLLCSGIFSLGSFFHCAQDGRNLTRNTTIGMQSTILPYSSYGREDNSGFKFTNFLETSALSLQRDSNLGSNISRYIRTTSDMP